MLTDTIAAISTPSGEGAIGVIRISGGRAKEILGAVFKGKTLVNVLKPRFFYYGAFVDEKDRVVDDGFCVYMNGPRTFTGEDVAELFCHGGSQALKTVLALVLNGGARLALPGEFTKRAYLNNRLDLTQAEAVIDVIRAQTDRALSAARARLNGGLSKRVLEIREGLLGTLAGIEAELDFPEDMVEGDRGLLNDSCRRAVDALQALIDGFALGSALRDGFEVLILGRPNAGKSSLLNALLQRERAIVSPQPGTTRDIVEERLAIRGIPVRLADTAGLREDPDHIEAIGARMAKERVEGASVILFVFDAAAGLTDEDQGLLGSLDEKKTIVVVNKCDLIDEGTAGRVSALLAGRPALLVSALLGTNIEALKDAIYHLLCKPTHGANTEEPLISSVRHKDALERAGRCVKSALSAIDSASLELVAEDLRGALNCLGELTGETITEDLLDRIFSDFCIGK